MPSRSFHVRELGSVDTVKATTDGDRYHQRALGETVVMVKPQGNPPHPPRYC